ncbi:MAG: hypothetical protein MPJ50_05680 [Pirellulales bacterium]|nr:hypothetical protein [Pirellulales bacterium]
MTSVPIAIFSAVLLLISTVLVAFDVRGYKRRRITAEKDDGRKSAWKRFRRRVQASAGIGVVGIVLMVSAFINVREHPLASAMLWLSAIVLTFWVAVIALVDLMGSRQQLAELRHQEMIQTAILKSELKRAQEEVREHSELQVNGKPTANDDARE